MSLINCYVKLMTQFIKKMSENMYNVLESQRNLIKLIY